MLPTTAAGLGFHLVLLGHSKVSHFLTSQQASLLLPKMLAAPGFRPKSSLGWQSKPLQYLPAQHSSSVLP